MKFFKKGKNFFNSFIVWRIKNIKDQQFLIFLSIICGFLSGIIAVFIKNLVYFIETLLVFNPGNAQFNVLFFVYPIFGILLVLLFKKYVVKKETGYGIPNVLQSISTHSGIMPGRNIFAPAIASSITLGFGGSVGMEGPSVNTGAAIGSNLGKRFGLKYKHLVLLIACGSSAAIAALFKAPITGVVLSLEILMIDLSMASLIPLLIASVTGTLTSYFFMGTNVIYHIESIDKFNFSDIPYFALLGVFCGFVSVYFTRILMIFDKVFTKLKKPYLKLIVGGSLLGILVLLFPALYGEGYMQINQCLRGDMSFIFDNSIFSDFKNTACIGLVLLAVIVLLKVIATSLTFSAGGVGGIFGPTLFLGAGSGLLFANFADFLKIEQLSRTNYALAGMTGLLAGVMHAPLTGIFLIAEITSGYHLIVPLIITAAVAYLTVRFFFQYSVDAISLAEKGELITHDKDKAVLGLMKIEGLIESNFIKVKPDYTLAELVRAISQSNRNIFPVVDDHDMLLGIVFLNDIRNIVFDTSLYQRIHVRDIMFMPEPIVNPDESMEEVARKFEKTDNYNLPVVKDGKYIGFVSRANVFSEYRRLIKTFSEE